MKTTKRIALSVLMITAIAGLGLAQVHGEDLAAWAGGPIIGGMLLVDAATWGMVLPIAGLIAVWVSNYYAKGAILMIGAFAALWQGLIPSERAFMTEGMGHARNIGDGDAIIPRYGTMAMGDMADNEIRLLRSLADTGNIIFDVADRLSNRQLKSMVEEAKAQPTHPVASILDAALAMRPVRRAGPVEGWNDLYDEQPLRYLPTSGVAQLGGAPGNMRARVRLSHTVSMRGEYTTSMFVLFLLAGIIAAGTFGGRPVDGHSNDWIKEWLQ